MRPHEIDFIRHCLPDAMGFPYYPDRESAWLLSRRLTAPARIAELRKGPLAKFLDRSSVRPVVAACGGTLAPGDLAPAGAPARFRLTDTMSTAARAGLTAAFGQPWHDFEVTLSDWATRCDSTWKQVSRPGGNLVLQLGFPSDHAALMGRYLGNVKRKTFEFGGHPIRRIGRPTLAWARLDLHLDTGDALIEEVQTDWLRFAREEAEDLSRHAPRSRSLRNAEAYDAMLRERYGRIWHKAVLLAALGLLVEDLGCRRVWMHQPEAGVVIKGIWGDAPPRSLYTALPKAFGFEPTDELPPFLVGNILHRRRKRLNKLPGPTFWRLTL